MPDHTAQPYFVKYMMAWHAKFALGIKFMGVDGFPLGMPTRPAANTKACDAGARLFSPRPAQWG